MGVHRPRPPAAHVPYPEFELGRDQVCPTPETLAHLREILYAPSTARSQEVLAHWTDQLGAWLDEREERERLTTAAREKEEKKRESEATAAREEEEKGKEEGELGATACEEERKEMVDTQTNTGDDEKGEDVEARRASPARASEPQTSTAENPRSRDHLSPVILHRPHAPTPIEVASLELVQEPPTVRRR